MAPIISISNLSKTYASGHRALKGVNLEIRKGEIFARLPGESAIGRLPRVIDEALRRGVPKT